MAYSKTIWQNDSEPSLNSQNLNKIEDGIEAAHELAEERVKNGGGFAEVLAGPEASRPATGVLNRRYRATDTGREWRDTGTAWALELSRNWSDITNKPATYPSDWSDITNKPATFPPSPHGHPATAISYGGSANLSATDVEGALDELDAEKAPLSHTHAAGDVTSGVFSPARLGSGTRDGTKYLRDDGSWQAVPGRHAIRDEGATVTPRGALNFVGTGVALADDATNDETKVHVPGPRYYAANTPFDVTKNLVAGWNTIPEVTVTIPALGPAPPGMKWVLFFDGFLRIMSGPASATVFVGLIQPGEGPGNVHGGAGRPSNVDQIVPYGALVDVRADVNLSAPFTLTASCYVQTAGTYRFISNPQPVVAVEAVPA